jgi:hypothetical protein
MRVSRAFAPRLAALIVIWFGGHINLLRLLHYNILLQDNIFKPMPVPRTFS